MIATANHTKEISDNGFTIIDAVFSEEEVAQILKAIDAVDKTQETFRMSTDLFAIRQFLKEVPGTLPFIFNEGLKGIIKSFFGDGYFVVKSIYFDKPETSNWFVSYHQDLTISVDKKLSIEGFSSWTVKQNQFAVQPPLAFLENIFTIRIHLDDTDEHNGALRVVPGSHSNGIYYTGSWSTETQTTCNVAKGGVMIMKPLLLHSSGRTTNNERRRVIHLEFSNMELPTGINWAERIN
ncbi:MAG TPA: phytanoyl-CoA dioxygenase family protein [Chitinophagales bacterium]|nr:phytanoyl-CoA dioxygenase family protein [Chitinophagales bacterium]